MSTFPAALLLLAVGWHGAVAWPDGQWMEPEIGPEDELTMKSDASSTDSFNLPGGPHRRAAQTAPAPISTVRGSVEELQKALPLMRQDLQDMVADNMKLMTKKTALRTRLDSIPAEHQQKLSAVENDLSALSDENAQAQESAVARNTSRIQRIKNLSATLNHLHTSNKQQQEQLITQRYQVKQQMMQDKRELQRLQKEAAATRTKLVSISARTAASEEKTMKMKERMGPMRRNYTQDQKKATLLSRQNDRLEQTLQVALEDKSRLEAEAARLSRSYDRTQNKKALMVGSSVSLGARVKQQEQALRTLKAENEEMQAANNRMKATYDSVTGTSSQTTAHNQEMSGDLTKLAPKVSLLMSKNEALRAELQGHAEELSGLRTEEASLKDSATRAVQKAANEVTQAYGEMIVKSKKHH